VSERASRVMMNDEITIIIPRVILALSARAERELFILLNLVSKSHNLLVGIGTSTSKGY
jgi:hypothetical protein